MPTYRATDLDHLTEEEVRTALDFLVAMEPSPPPDTREAYEAVLRPYRSQIDAVMATIHLFARQATPARSSRRGSSIKISPTTRDI